MKQEDRTAVVTIGDERSGVRISGEYHCVYTLLIEADRVLSRYYRRPQPPARGTGRSRCSIDSHGLATRPGAGMVRDYRAPESPVPGQGIQVGASNARM